MAIEITVKVSDDDQTLTQQFLHYNSDEPLSISHDDPHLSSMVNATKDNFHGEATDIIVKLKYTW